jgi:hypothetical protein
LIIPPTSLIRQNDTHRLIPSRYGAADSVLARIADTDAQLKDIADLESATNDRLLAENNLLPGIGIHELVFGVANYPVVNAAFCHAHPLGSRFNGPERGAWYASFEAETAQAEVAFHKCIEFAESGWFDEELTYDDYLADFSAEFHDIRGDHRFLDCLLPESYVKSQDLAAQLLDAGALGIVFPSVRRVGGTCIACFRPALVMNVRQGPSYRFVWKGSEEPAISPL